MHGSRIEKNDLRCLHGIMLREVNLQLVGFAGIEGACRSGYLNHPPLEIIGDLVLEPGRGAELPLG
jgi:hypothetical protein